MFKVNDGQKLKNVMCEDGKTRNFYGGDILPKDFIPNESWIANKIIEEVKDGFTNRKTRERNI